MSRPTLKLPAKPASDRSGRRKPIRGGGLARPPRPTEPGAASTGPKPPFAKGAPAKPRPAKAPFAKASFAKAPSAKSPPTRDRGLAGASAGGDRKPPERPARPPIARSPSQAPAAGKAIRAPRTAPPRTAAAPATTDKTTAAPRPPRRPSAIPVWPGVSNSQPRPSAGKPPASAPRPRRTAPPITSTTAPPPAEAAPPAAPTFARAGLPEQPRLSKRMSELGLCSRREADEWIENGWVKVDGVVVDTLGTRVSPKAKIEIDARAKNHQAESVTILLNKPIGYVSGQAEDGYEPAAVLVRPENRWEEDGSRKEFKPGHLRGLAPAGRLDIDSTGLLVLTQDGRIARRLIGEDSEVEKEYLVRVEGTLAEGGLEKLNHGLSLDGIKLKPAKVSWANEDQLRFVLREGKKRQIRRMCELVGLNVVGLKRVRIGSVALGKLPVGNWRYLRFDEKF